jgi:septal ring factor EnvC (AmiA/AmiB activator)
MRKTHRAISLLLAMLLVPGILVLSSCSSSPSEEEMMQLNNLKEEYAALQKELATLNQEKSALEKELAEKEAMLKKCNEDQATVRMRLGK